MGENSRQEHGSGGGRLSHGYVRDLFAQICDYIEETNPIIASILAQGDRCDAEAMDALKTLSKVYTDGETLLTALKPLADGSYANDGAEAAHGCGAVETRGCLPELPNGDCADGGSQGAGR